MLTFYKTVFDLMIQKRCLLLNKWSPIRLRRYYSPRYDNVIASSGKQWKLKQNVSVVIGINSPTCNVCKVLTKTSRKWIWSHKKFIVGKLHGCLPHYGFSNLVKRAVSSSKDGHLTLQLFDIWHSGAFAFGLPPKILTAIMFRVWEHKHISERMSGQTA